LDHHLTTSIAIWKIENQGKRPPKAAHTAAYTIWQDKELDFCTGPESRLLKVNAEAIQESPNPSCLKLLPDRQSAWLLHRNHVLKTRIWSEHVES